VVTNGLLASLCKQMLILFTELSILQADGTVLMPRCVKLLLGNGEGVVRLANLILETRVFVDGYIRSAFSNTGYA
jgi:hypothetical protein